MGADRQEPVAITDREELIYLLSEASELEHGLSELDAVQFDVQDRVAPI